MKRMISLLLLLIAVIFTFVGSTTTTLAKDTDIIRVGWFIQPGYMEKSEDGVYSGYNYEYLKAISRYTGWKYEFVEGSMSELYEQLKSGEIDMLGCLFYSEERAKELDFSSYYMGLSHLTMFTLEESLVSANDYKAFDGMRIGVTSDANKSKLEVFAKEKGFTYIAKEIADYDQLQVAFKNDEIDAAVYGGFQVDDTTRIIAQFSPEPFYFATSKGNTKVLSGINNAISEIIIANPYFSKDLAYKYLSTNKTYFSLTNDEKEFIKKLPELTVSYNVNWPPFEMQNKDGEFTGIVAQVYKEITKLTGLKFNYIPTTTSSESKPDIIGSMEQNFDMSSALGMSLTDSFLAVPSVFIRKSAGGDANKRIAVPSRYYSYKYLEQEGYTIVVYDGLEDCIKAVKNGTVGQAIINSVSAETFLSKSKYKGLTRVAFQVQPLKICIAVSDDLDPMVYNILNKAVNYLSDSQINDIIISNTFNENKIDFNKILDQMPTDVILIMFLFLCFAFISVSVAFVIRIRSSKRIENILFYDSLTGVLTKYGFEEKAKEIISKSDKNFFVIDLDINKFNVFNSLQGKAEGDALLQKVAQMVMSKCSENELCARIYADQFVCLIQGEKVEEIFEKVIADEYNFIDESSNLLISFKYGIYEVRDKKLSISKIIDLACAAKQMIDIKSGKYYGIYSEKFYQNQIADISLLSEVENAMINKEFIAFYQPKFDSKTERIVAAEALVRWRRPNGEMIGPYRFIELFEKNGWIRKLDFYMLAEVCNYQRRLKQDGVQGIPISVNFSGLHFYDIDFTNKIKDIVVEYGLDNNLIEIEFTETQMIENLAAAQNIFLELRQLGFKIAIDDFGSGYSSLNSLKDIPIDIVKLDRGFFMENDSTYNDGNEISNKEKADLIVCTVIKLANKMNLKTVAEGIETKKQFEFVRSCGCDMIQGYYFSKPVEVSKFYEMLANNENM